MLHLFSFVFICSDCVQEIVQKLRAREGFSTFFREKLNRRNVTVVAKHYEDCEQLIAGIFPDD